MTFMHVGPMAYDVVILPNLTTIRSTTLNALEQLHHQGGNIYFLGDAPSLVDAMPNDRAQRLAIESFRAKDIDDLCFQLDSIHTIDSIRKYCILESCRSHKSSMRR